MSRARKTSRRADMESAPTGWMTSATVGPNGVGAVQSVKNARVPILILHGENDGFVPCSMAEEIYNSCNGGRYLYTFKGADHGMSYMTDPEKYERATIDFIDRCSEVNN